MEICTWNIFHLWWRIRYPWFSLESEKFSTFTTILIFFANYNNTLDVFLLRYHAALSLLNPNNVAAFSLFFSSTRRMTPGLGGCCFFVQDPSDGRWWIIRFEIRLPTYFYFAPRLRGRIRSNCITIPVKRGVTSSGGEIFKTLSLSLFLTTKYNNILEIYFSFGFNEIKK